MKVLLSDDSRTIRMILRNILKDLGITDVQEATNGQDALDRLFAAQYDLILMDIHMPMLEGLDVLEAIKTRPGSLHVDTPVVIISSDTDYRQIERARDLNAFGYIKKPFKKEGLEAAIAAARRQAAKRAEAAASKTALPVATPAPAQASAPAPESTPQPTDLVAVDATDSVAAQQPKRGLFGWIRKLVASR